MIQLILGVFMTIAVTTVHAKSMPENNPVVLPDYVLWNENDSNSVVRKKAIALQFPLQEEDKKDIETLEKKFDAEQGCVGLAAPQIGISKRFIIFEMPDNPEWKKWRKDLVQTMPKTILINPIYEPIGESTHEDYEACFTIPNIAGPVNRYKKIKYTGYDLKGNLVTGTAEGFLARDIQHEIDHLDGILYIDYVSKEKLMSIDEYKAKRKKAIEDSKLLEQ